MSIPNSPAPGTPQTPTKAVLAAVIAALTSLVAAVQGRTDLDTLGATGWVTVLVSAVVAGLAVYVVPNSAKGGAR